MPREWPRGSSKARRVGSPASAGWSWRSREPEPLAERGPDNRPRLLAAVLIVSGIVLGWLWWHQPLEYGHRRDGTLGEVIFIAAAAAGLILTVVAQLGIWIETDSTQRATAGNARKTAGNAIAILAMLVLLFLIVGWVGWHQRDHYMGPGPGPRFVPVLMALAAAAVELILLPLYFIVAQPSFRVGTRLMLLVVVGCLGASILDSVPWEQKVFPVEVVGVVSATEALSDEGVRVTLDDGREIELWQGTIWSSESPPTSAYVQGLSSEDLETGSLLLAGSKPRPWFLIAASQSAPKGASPCYRLPFYGTEQRASFELITDANWPGEWISLSKAPDFDSEIDRVGDKYEADLCLNTGGQVRYLLNAPRYGS